MAESFNSGDIIWVKCGQLFWPAKVLSPDDLPDDVKEDLAAETKQPKVIAKFFDEEGYEFLRDTKNVFPYNGPKKEDFIKKGVAKYRSTLKQGAKPDDGWFSKFPKDIVKCEELTGGDPKLLEKEPYVERVEQKIDYKDIFGPADDSAKKKGKKGSKNVDEQSPAHKGGRKRGSLTPSSSSPSKKGRRDSSPQRPIVHPRFRAGGGGSDHQIKIMYQPSTPYHLDLQKKEELAKQKSVGVTGSPAAASSAGAVGGSPGGLGSPTPYKCHICGFAATRLNVIIACQKKCSEAMKNKQQQPKGKSTPRSSLGSPLASPSRKQVVSKAKGGSSPASRPAKKAATESTPKKTASPKKSTATTGATAAAASPAAASKRKSSLNGNDKNAATVVSADSAKAKGASGPTGAQSPAPVAKKQRMTKKQKIEQEKKKETRKNILDEWGDEEEDESDEKKRINETLGRSSGGEGSDDEDGDSVHGEGVFGDDNIHGNYDDNEDEEIEQETASSEEKDKGKSSEAPQPASKEELSTDHEAEKSPGAVDKTENKDKSDQLLSADIGKLLEETKVPELPSSEIRATPALTESEESPKPKKSIKFSESLTKELQQKKFQLVQPESNLDVPDEVDDEFAESAGMDIPYTPPSAVKPILKNVTTPAVATKSLSSDANNQASAQVVESAAASGPKVHSNAAAEEETVSSLLALQAGNVAAAAADKSVATPTSEEVPSTAATSAAPATAATSENQEETYILLVDENSQVDSSQVLYLDPNSLANGNVLLMQGSNGTATAVPGQAQAVVTSGTAAPASVQPQAAPSSSACQQQTVMTTVGDNTPLQPVQTVKEQVTPQQANEQALG